MMPSGLSIGRARSVALFAGVMALVVMATDRAAFWQAYLLGWLFWFGIAIGSLGLLLLFHLTGGKWGKALEPTLESAAATLPWWGLLFIPVLSALPQLYAWARPEWAASSPVAAHKALYLNEPFFMARAVVFFLFWGALSVWVPRWASRVREHRDALAADRLKLASSLGLLLFVLTLTFAAFDWMMSLDPLWGSSIYGVLLLVGSVLSALAFGVVTLYLSEASAHPEPVGAIHDLGNLLLAFTMLWAYVMLSQYLIIWYANLPEEIGWYQLRGRGSWAAVAAFLVLAQFVMPFLLLLARANKRNLSTLGKVALWILAVRFVDLFWLVIPEFRRSGFSIGLGDLVVPVALGGAWVSQFLRGRDAR